MGERPGGTLSDRIRLLELIDGFLDGRGEDRSVARANEIEGVLIDSFATESWFEEASLALALYQPGRLSHVAEEEMITVLREVKSHLTPTKQP